MKLYIVMSDIPSEPTNSWITYFTDKKKAEEFFEIRKIDLYAHFVAECTEEEIAKLVVEYNANGRYLGEYFVSNEYCGETIYFKEVETDNKEMYELF